MFFLRRPVLVVFVLAVNLVRLAARRARSHVVDGASGSARGRRPGAPGLGCRLSRRTGRRAGRRGPAPILRCAICRSRFRARRKPRRRRPSIDWTSTPARCSGWSANPGRQVRDVAGVLGLLPGNARRARLDRAGRQPGRRRVGPGDVAAARQASASSSRRSPRSLRLPHRRPVRRGSACPPGHQPRTRATASRRAARPGRHPRSGATGQRTSRTSSPRDAAARDDRHGHRQRPGRDRRRRADTALDVTIQAQILDVLRTAQRETGAGCCSSATTWA